MHKVYVGNVISHDGLTPVTCVGVKLGVEDRHTAAALDLVMPMDTRLPAAEKGQKPSFVIVPLAGGMPLRMTLERCLVIEWL